MEPLIPGFRKLAKSGNGALTPPLFAYFSYEGELKQHNEPGPTGMIAQLPNLETILKRHEIHPRFWAEFHALVECGVRPGKELRTRLERVSNYKAALDEVLAELSEPLTHKIPPPVQYQSLTLEEVSL